MLNRTRPSDRVDEREQQQKEKELTEEKKEKEKIKFKKGAKRRAEVGTSA